MRVDVSLADVPGPVTCDLCGQTAAPTVRLVTHQTSDTARLIVGLEMCEACFHVMRGAMVVHVDHTRELGAAYTEMGREVE